MPNAHSDEKAENKNTSSEEGYACNNIYHFFTPFDAGTKHLTALTADARKV